MELEKIFNYIITNFEGIKFQNVLLNKKENKNIEKICEERQKIIDGISDKEYNKLIEMLSKNFMEQFIKGDSKAKFAKHDCEHLLTIYESLIMDISNEELNDIDIIKAHVDRIKKFITHMGEDNCGCEHNHHEILSYSPAFILDILGADENSIKGKVLDIGCRKNADLVKYLRSKNIDAYGIDINVDENEYLENEDWLQKDFGDLEYDMIFSNIAFTKHFLLNHLSDGDEYIDYANTYMKILNSLKVGGTFHYAPALDFIEELLPEDKFFVMNEFIDDNNMRTVVKRIK